MMRHGRRASGHGVCASRSIERKEPRRSLAARSSYDALDYFVVSREAIDTNEAGAEERMITHVSANPVVDSIDVDAGAPRVPRLHRPHFFHSAAISSSVANSPRLACSKPSIAPARCGTRGDNVLEDFRRVGLALRWERLDLFNCCLKNLDHAFKHIRVPPACEPAASMTIALFEGPVEGGTVGEPRQTRALSGGKPNRSRGARSCRASLRSARPTFRLRLRERGRRAPP
jgi:hypothetical protein